MDNLISALPITGIIILAICGWEFLKLDKRNQVTKMTLVLEDNKLGELDDVAFSLFHKFANNNLPPKSELWKVIHNERSRRSVKQSDEKKHIWMGYQSPRKPILKYRGDQ